MDDLDHKILQLLAENARMPVKDIAQRVSLTSPAVSSRIHRLEQEGVIGGYTVVLRPPPPPRPPPPRISPSQDFRPYRIPVASFPGLFINTNILLSINKK